MKLKNKYKKNIFNIKYNMKKNIWKKNQNLYHHHYLLKALCSLVRKRPISQNFPFKFPYTRHFAS